MAKLTMFINENMDLAAKIGGNLVVIPCGYGTAREVLAYYCEGSKEFAKFDHKVMARIIESLVRCMEKASIGRFEEMESVGNPAALPFSGSVRPLNTRIYL